MGNGTSSRKTEAIIQFYRASSEAPYWSTARRRFTEKRANSFFVGVMLDQMQPAERAWKGAKYLVDNYFRETDYFWSEIENTHLTRLRNICRTGYNEQSFALNVVANSFPNRLKSAARKIVSDYNSDVRNIWNGVDKKDVDEIYRRFAEFEGIGDALAKMAQFILVRDYGVAGGRASKKYMSVKPDVHLQRVMFRLGMYEEESARSVIVIADSLKLRSPADFDWAVWNIGRSYCHSKDPNCCDCPLKEVCDQQGLHP